MAKEQLTYVDVCQVAEELYRTQHDTVEWPPSMNARDSKAPPSHTGAFLAENEPLTRREVMALIQNGFGCGAGGRPKQGSCHHCGKAGHWKPDCPDLKVERASSGKSKMKTQSMIHVDKNGCPRLKESQSKKWCRIEPTSGESTTKRVGDITFRWCAKCKLWTMTHDMVSHVKKVKTNPPSNTQVNMSLHQESPFLLQDPSAWCVRSRPPPHHH
jgi:hypothetical protein